MPPPDQPGVGAACLALAPAGKALLAGGPGGAVWRWDLARRRPLPPWFVGERAAKYWQAITLARKTGIPCQPHYADNVCALAVSPRGRYFATATDDGRVQVWDAVRGAVCRTLPHRHADVASLAFGPRDDTLAVNDGGAVRLWDPATGRPRGRLAPGHRERILSMAWSPDGATLATGGHDRRVFLCDVAGGGCRLFAGHTDAVSALAFCPDRRALASGSWDGTLRLWHLATGQEVAVLEGHAGKVQCLAFAPDGRTLASGGEAAGGRGEVLLWRAAGP